MPLDFPDRPQGTPEELARDVKDLVPQLERRFITAQTIGTSSTPIAHGLTATPRGFAVMPQSDARVWRAAVSDEKRIYLIASASVVCDIEVIP